MEALIHDVDMLGLPPSIVEDEYVRSLHANDDEDAYLIELRIQSYLKNAWIYELGGKNWSENKQHGGNRKE